MQFASKSFKSMLYMSEVTISCFNCPTTISLLIHFLPSPQINTARDGMGGYSWDKGESLPQRQRWPLNFPFWIQYGSSSTSIPVYGTSTGSYFKYRHFFQSMLYWTIDKLLPKLWRTKSRRKKSSLCRVRLQLTGLSFLNISTYKMVFYLKYAWSFSCGK